MNNATRKATSTALAVVAVAVLASMLGLPAQAQILVTGHVPTCTEDVQHGAWAESSCTYSQYGFYRDNNFVRSIQGAMNRWGYHVHGLPHTAAGCSQAYGDSVNGYFGGCTVGAVKNFQYYHSPLTADGVVGPQTWTYMQRGTPQNLGVPSSATWHSSVYGCREGWNSSRTALYAGSCSFSNGHHNRPYPHDMYSGSGSLGTYPCCDSPKVNPMWQFAHETKGCWTRVWSRNQDCY